MNAEEESYARREDVSPAKTECAEKRNGRPDPIAAPVPKGARLSVTTSGGACRLGLILGGFVVFRTFLLLACLLLFVFELLLLRLVFLFELRFDVVRPAGVIRAG